MVTTLDTMCFPLHGARLIEASAGTGKTFTIAGLYLRLLLGHGDDQTRHTIPLSVEQILVVTFTEAATAELRDRIRARIHSARIAFLRGESSDPVIRPLLQEVSDHAWAAQTLLDAERQMDEAAVYTIHGFCQRMLTQNAFESGSRFNNEFVTDESHLKATVVCDYWRKNFYPLPAELAGLLRSYWRSPADLLAQIGGYLSGTPLALSAAPMQDSLAKLHQQNLADIDALKQAWLAVHEDISQIISESDVSKRSFTKKNLPAWLAEVSTWAAMPSRDYSSPDALVKFSAGFLAEKTPAGKRCPQHAIFDRIEAFLAQPPELKQPLLAHAISSCRAMLAQAKQQRRWLSFDDLLSQLSAAIDGDSQGLLAERIRQLYPVAMIDEFQDTDPLQYSIFSRIYLAQPQCGLFMIGDPKQAIYGFRGADIFTYIKARNEVSDHYTLGVNWRSSADMVAAVNQVFGFADSPFLYDADIPFLPVDHCPGAELRGWQLEGQQQPAMSFWLQPADAPLAKSDYVETMAEACANQIDSLLQHSAGQQAHYVNSKGEACAVQAGDIAVLVRTGSEGRKVREALAVKGIASVYLSNRDSVFTSPVARDIQRMLQAALNPEDETALRAVLASDLLFLHSGQLDELNRDESLLDDVMYEFREYRKLWLQRGVMPMLRSIMSKRHIAENLLTEPFGERLLTDYLHLAELLQQASLTTESQHALSRWFAEQIEQALAGERGAADEEIQRLESESNLVQIVTIHKSKGLEYPFVFLPFASACREAVEAKYYDADSGQTRLDLAGGKQALSQADHERLAEDLRLLYVALTRAVYGCFVGIAPLRKGRSRKDPSGAHLSAMGYLIQNGAELGASELAVALSRQLADAGAEIVQAGLPEPCNRYSQLSLFDEQQSPPLLAASKLSREIDRSWRITSYSALVKQGHAGHDATDEVAGLDVDSLDDMVVSQADEQEWSVFTFPRGARPGTFLHSLFEQVDFIQPATSEHNQQVISRLLEQEQYEPQWLPVLQCLVDTVLSVPLDGEALYLNQKDSAHKLVEMEFMLPLDLLTSPQLNQLLQEHDSLSARAGVLGFQTVSGMLKGFIDLVFEHQGRYYILDWKSNHLGDEISAYTPAALEQAMIEHRYDLQYQIYALALHRFLQSRIKDYSYERHFGGVYYLFLRGIDPQASAELGCGIFTARPQQALIEGLDSLFSGESLTDTKGGQDA